MSAVTGSYTPAELMVVAAAREIRDAEFVFVGMRLPLIAFALAKRTHAPSATGVFEAGLVRDTPAPELLFTMADPPNIAGAAWATGLWEVMAYLQRGEVDLGFIGGAEVDRRGNLNTSYIGSVENPTVKLPGSGGAADIAGLSKRFVIIMQHDRRRFRQRVDFITSPGHGDDHGSPNKSGIRGGGPSALITTLAIFSFPEGDATVRSIHPFTTAQEVAASTGWDVGSLRDVAITPEPTPEELRIIRNCDPHGFWTGGV